MYATLRILFALALVSAVGCQSQDASTAPVDDAKPITQSSAPEPTPAPQPTAAAAPAAPAAAPAAVSLEGITKAEGGYTVEDLYAKKSELGGKQIALRGRVVKYNSGIMGKNWLHLRDGTGAEGSNDLTVTTSEPAAVGDTVLIQGTVAVDKDFGAGYRYGLIVEDAKVTKE